MQDSKQTGSPQVQLEAVLAEIEEFIYKIIEKREVDEVLQRNISEGETSEILETLEETKSIFKEGGNIAEIINKLRVDFINVTGKLNVGNSLTRENQNLYNKLIEKWGIFSEQKLQNTSPEQKKWSADFKKSENPTKIKNNEDVSMSGSSIKEGDIVKPELKEQLKIVFVDAQKFVVDVVKKGNCEYKEALGEASKAVQNIQNELFKEKVSTKILTSMIEGFKKQLEVVKNGINVDTKREGELSFHRRAWKIAGQLDSIQLQPPSKGKEGMQM
jgi:hypothetical protein